METIRDPAAWARISASSSAGGVGPRANPGTRTVSASASADRSAPTASPNPDVVATVPALSPQTMTAYRWAASWPKTWVAMVRSKATTPGGATTATRCGALAGFSRTWPR